MLDGKSLIVAFFENSLSLIGLEISKDKVIRIRNMKYDLRFMSIFLFLISEDIFKIKYINREKIQAMMPDFDLVNNKVK
ncbi:hypothetical protein SDC9_118344 [bioreactor metagenome]|uniref:Uncharacterized protein n=1 Tax=bioreactor metagenome TaxID=1076179 RepID=A0A645C169_9ZZZZ